MKESLHRCTQIGVLLLLFLASAPTLAADPVTAPAGSAADASNPPRAIGQISAAGDFTAQIGPDAIAFPASNLVYLEGTRIATSSGSDGHLTLTLRGGSIFLASDSAAIVSEADGLYRISLEKGTLRVRFDNSSGFEVVSDGLRFQPLAVSVTSALTVDEARFDAVFSIKESGGVVVASHRGVLAATGAALEKSILIADGEIEALGTIAPPGSFAVAANYTGSPFGVSSGGEDAAHDAGSGGRRRGQVPWMPESVKWEDVFVGGAFVAAGATMVTFGLLEDDHDDAPVTSPVQ